MSRNPIQFQPGLSLPEFIRLYGTEKQCESALEVVRWPHGFHCPHCGDYRHSNHYRTGRKISNAIAVAGKQA